MLDYFHSRKLPRMMLPTADIFLSTAAFAISHLVTEYYTGRFLDFKLGIIYGPTVTSRQWERVHDRFISDMLTEAVWVIMAAIVVFMVQWLFQSTTCKPRPNRAWIAAIFAGVFYCWVGWGIDLISRILQFSFTEFASYLTDMAVAALVGIILAILRRKLSEPTEVPVLRVVPKGP